MMFPRLCLSLSSFGAFSSRCTDSESRQPLQARAPLPAKLRCFGRWGISPNVRRVLSRVFLFLVTIEDCQTAIANKNNYNDKNTTAMNGKPTTTDPVKPGDFTGVLPEWGRSPDVDRQMGIGRATLYVLHKQGKIRGCVLRARGKKSGLRLWDMQSIRDYIQSELARGEAATQEAA